MQIDNSRAEAFRLCPWYYYEAYVRNVQPKKPIGDDGYGALDLGTRVHELMEEFYKGALTYQPHPNGSLEAEAQWMLEEYKAHYPQDHWEVLDVERLFRVTIPGTQHVYVGKLDLFVRDLDDGKCWIIDHKTEKRGSKSHIPQKLAVSDQGSLYLWAARRFYPQVDGMKYNILTRPSEKHQKGPSFPERYQIERSEHEIEIAVRDLIVVADQIEEFTKKFGDGEWPSNRQNCYDYYPCDFYKLHRFGEDPSLILKHEFEQRREYLNLDGVDVTS